MNHLASTTRRAFAAIAAAALVAPAMAAGPLQLDVYNPGHEAVFPVSSVLVSGKREAVLIDAQFGQSQALQLVGKIRASGKKLTTVYISHGDPDYYFGLETIHAAFPDAKIVATPQTVAHIQETAAGKLAFWGPQLKADAPVATIVPEVLQGDSLSIEGRTLEIKGLDGAQPERSYVWIPSLKAVVGGVVLANNLHVWMADTQTPQSHADWLATLADIQKLRPAVVVPGHYLPGASKALNAARYTADYIRSFDREAAKAANSQALIKAMKKQFPKAGEPGSLEISAKVAKGEMKW
ncbi:MBL fold metallo-hydrolase [Rhodoferax koreense]|uniref:MBL fold metallo-hydrolase n=1 Tax=Rhodoferax koreensis TaxID=1842727 RepID=A0A1P8JW36_9BURK|nr:MBL fold metallo-hydrolase [Rhodoferax koreense]APW37964.1 MBL fold metallo-hydrolase [Rhodoferax koreense]